MRSPIEQAYWNLAWAIVRCEHRAVVRGQCVKCEANVPDVPEVVSGYGDGEPLDYYRPFGKGK